MSSARDASTPAVAATNGQGPSRAIRTSAAARTMKPQALDADAEGGPAVAQEKDAPPERSEMGRSQADAGGEGGDDRGGGHWRCIHRQAVHKPTAAPSIMSGAVKKMPVLSVQSSQRPTTTPSRIGTTIAHPSTPI